MGKKRKEKKGMYDFDAYDQMRMLEKITESIETGQYNSDLDENHYENEDDGSDGFFDMIGKMVAEKTSLQTGTNNDEIRREESNDYTSHLDNQIFNEFTINRSNNEFRLVKLSDGIKELVIDLNSLNPDEIDLGDGENIEQMVTSIVITEILPNFYPTIITSVDKLNEVFRHVSDIDSDKFHFYEYPDNSGSIVIGYYLSEQTLDTLNELVGELSDSGHLISFLCTLKDMSSMSGFTFANLTDTYSKQLMLTSRFVTSSDNFIERLLEDEDTEKSDSVDNDSIFDAVTVLPFYYEDEFVDNLLISNNGDDNSDDNEDYQEDDLFSGVPVDEDNQNEVASEEEPTEVDPSYNVTEENEEVSGITINSKKEDSSENNSDDTNDENASEDDLFSGVPVDEYEQDEAERLEEEYFGNQKHQRSSMKSGKKMKKDFDDDFVVRRHK